MKRNNQITGNIGMYFACYELSRLGLNVLPTSRNAKGADIVAYTSNQEHFLTFQVKTLSKLSNISLGKTLEFGRSDWWIVVIDAYDTPTAFVLTPDEVRQSARLYDGNYWAQGKELDSEVTRNAWDRILSNISASSENR